LLTVTPSIFSYLLATTGAAGIDDDADFALGQLEVDVTLDDDDEDV
jgi:hypothetical protein